MKALLSAFACEPGRGSEPKVGWETALQLSKHHEVCVITDKIRHRQAIEAELATNPVPRLEFVYYSLPRWTKWWERGVYGYHVNYYLWQIAAYFVARKLHRQVRFDLVHHVTLVRYCTPSFIALLPIPFIWGPVGGGESAPKAFWRDFSLRGKIFETLREFVRWIEERDPFVYLTARRSAMAIGTTEDTAARLRALGARQVKVAGQIGLSQEEIELLGRQPPPGNSPVRFIGIARLHNWKGFHLGLRAFAVAKLEGAQYWIVGDGPERKRLETLARELGIADKVYFWGLLPRSKTLSKLGECHVLVHPSLHESGGTVCLEAMAAGRPVVCLNLGGPATQVTKETGFKVPTHTPEQAVRDLAGAMGRLACDSELRIRMGEAGRRRVSEEYNWEVKGQFLNELYREVFDRL